jgi:prephenate dehydrogenase
MEKVSIAILGLGRLGTSIGLTLKAYNKQERPYQFEVTGYDTVAERVKQAKEINAIDTPKHRPVEATRDKAIVVITMPYGEVNTAYDMIANELRADTVIIDFSTLKHDVMEQATKKLPANVHLVCAAPVFNPKYLFDGVDETQRASDDLFQDGMLMLMPSVKCAEAAIKLANNFSEILGAKPQFFDPYEHDALIAATETLPAFLSVTYFTTLNEGKGWDDTQRLTNPAFGMLSRYLFDHHPDDILKTWQDNRPHLVRNVNAFLKTLTTLRNLLQEEEDDAIAALLEEQAKDYEAWINKRYNNNWVKDDLAAETPTWTESMGNMFGNLLRRKKDDDDD